jgi:hypothetical protein
MEFVDELSRQVCDMSKEEQQKTAGGLIKMLMKKGLTTKAQVSLKTSSCNSTHDLVPPACSLN